MVGGLRLFTQRIGDGAGQPFLDDVNGEELMHLQPNVSIVLANHAVDSAGTLYISTKGILKASDAVDFLSLLLHAVSRDPEAYSSPCIYTQIETGGEDDDSEDSDSECNETLDLSMINEMRLVPSDPSQLDTLFEIFCECAELNPEPIEEEEEEHNWVFSADQMEDEVMDGEDSAWNGSSNPTNTIGHSNGDRDLARTLLELQIDDQRFEDAKEMDRDDKVAISEELS